VTFAGGFDSDTPAISLPPGFVRRCMNYEQSIAGGYQTPGGYERFNGKAKPSAATFIMLPCSTIGSNASNGTVTITGATSGATGVIIAATATHLVLTVVTGTFQAENASPGSVVISGTKTAASSALLKAQYNNLAADVYRALIDAVPGEGKVLGVYGFFNASVDVVYAFRNAVGGLTAAMFKSSGTGWTEIALGEEISFSNANTAVADADVLTQGGVTATINRVVVESGSLPSGVNTGRLIISGRAGGNFAAGAATSTGAGALTLSAVQTAITLLPGGRYKFVTNTFGGGANTKKLYGADGVNRGFEFDGTVFVPIATGMAADTPTLVYPHKNHLFFSFAGSLQHSGIGTPYVWSVVSGSSELALGDIITGLMQQAGSDTTAALTVTTRNTIAILYGTSSADWKLIHYKKEVGALAHTIQQVGHTMMLDDRGITKLETTLAYGNFTDATMSERIRSWLTDKTLLNTQNILPTESVAVQSKNQYRIYFSDGSAIYATIFNTGEGTDAAFMPQLLPNVVRCMSSEEDSYGSINLYFGSDSGHIYQMDHGTSFDGADIEAYIDLAYNSSKTPGVNKEYIKGTFEVFGSGYSEVSLGYLLGYGASDIIQPANVDTLLALGASFYDSGLTYDFGHVYDGAPLAPASFGLDGEAVNISLKIKSRSDYYSVIRFSGVLLEYIFRDKVR